MERKEKIARWKKRTQKWRQENKIILNKRTSTRKTKERNQKRHRPLSSKHVFY